jgi:hypothetical protein
MLAETVRAVAAMGHCASRNAAGVCVGGSVNLPTVAICIVAVLLQLRFVRRRRLIGKCRAVDCRQQDAKK